MESNGKLMLQSDLTFKFSERTVKPFTIESKEKETRLNGLCWLLIKENSFSVFANCTVNKSFQRTFYECSIDVHYCQEM